MYCIIFLGTDSFIENNVDDLLLSTSIVLYIQLVFDLTNSTNLLFYQIGTP